jgi:hypothetical protein
MRRKPECSPGGVDAAAMLASGVDGSRGAAVVIGRTRVCGSEPQAASRNAHATIVTVRSRLNSDSLVKTVAD